MLHKCANPECAAPFRNISRGKLFHLATATLPLALPSGRNGPPPVIEHYWLCDQCTTAFTLAMDPQIGLNVVPLATPLRQPVQATADWPARLNDGPDNLGENWEVRRKAGA